MTNREALIACRRSGQISDAQWEQHVKEDPILEAMSHPPLVIASVKVDGNLRPIDGETLTVPGSEFSQEPKITVVNIAQGGAPAYPGANPYPDADKITLTGGAGSGATVTMKPGAFYPIAATDPLKAVAEEIRAKIEEAQLAWNIADDESDHVLAELLEWRKEAHMADLAIVERHMKGI